MHDRNEVTKNKPGLLARIFGASPTPAAESERKGRKDEATLREELLVAKARVRVLEGQVVEGDATPEARAFAGLVEDARAEAKRIEAELRVLAATAPSKLALAKRHAADQEAVKDAVHAAREFEDAEKRRLKDAEARRLDLQKAVNVARSAAKRSGEARRELLLAVSPETRDELDRAERAERELGGAELRQLRVNEALAREALAHLEKTTGRSQEFKAELERARAELADAKAKHAAQLAKLEQATKVADAAREAFERELATLASSPASAPSAK